MEFLARFLSEIHHYNDFADEHMSSSTCLAHLNAAISEDEVLNAKVACIKININRPKNKIMNGKKLNKLGILIVQFQVAANSLDAPILHRQVHSAQLCKVLQDPSFTATQLCPINKLTLVDYIQVLCIMHNLQEMPTFPHSVTKKVEEKVEEKIMMVHNAEDPLFEEDNFGTAGMNGESLPFLCPFGTATEQQVDICSSHVSPSSGRSSNSPSSIPSQSSSLMHVSRTFCYSTIGIRCNRLIIYMRHWHSKYKWVHPDMLESNNMIDHTFDLSRQLCNVGYLPKPVLICFH